MRGLKILTKFFFYSDKSLSVLTGGNLTLIKKVSPDEILILQCVKSLGSLKAILRFATNTRVNVTFSKTAWFKLR
jgi:hypothetical protein